MGFDGGRVSDPEETLRRLRSVPEVEVQLLKADFVAGKEHLQFAARNALVSFYGKGRRSKSLAVEYLLYLSCQRQISKAIRLLGIRASERRVLLVALSGSNEALQKLEQAALSIIGGSIDEDLAEIGSELKLKKIQNAYGVTKREIEATRFPGESEDDVVKRLVIERSALLDLSD